MDYLKIKEQLDFVPGSWGSGQREGVVFGCQSSKAEGGEK